MTRNNGKTAANQDQANDAVKLLQDQIKAYPESAAIADLDNVTDLMVLLSILDTCKKTHLEAEVKMKVERDRVISAIRSEVADDDERLNGIDSMDIKDLKALLAKVQKVKMISSNIRPNIKTDDIDFIDYLPSKLVSGCMLVLEGKRIDHDQPIGLAAIGRVHLKLANIETHIANVFEKSVVLTGDALALPEKTSDAVTVDDLVAFKDEIGKQWCYAVKMQKLADKEAKEKAAKQKRGDRRSALINALRNSK